MLGHYQRTNSWRHARSEMVLGRESQHHVFCVDLLHGDIATRLQYAETLLADHLPGSGEPVYRNCRKWKSLPLVIQALGLFQHRARVECWAQCHRLIGSIPLKIIEPSTFSTGTETQFFPIFTFSFLNQSRKSLVQLSIHTVK